MVEFTCRRCGGKRRLSDEDQDCFVCLGKGVIRITQEEVRELYRQDEKKNDR
jgi:DnaJ-class molecular chaperone